MRYFSMILLSFILTTAVIAQDNCSSHVEELLASVDTLCEETGRNELCYGNNIVSVTTESGEMLDFSQPGDIISIDEVEAIRTNPYAEPDEWGVALMRLQANIPDSLPGQNVTFLLFGDTNVSSTDSEVPMQAIYFSSGIGESTCNDVPQDGILIQTPDYEEPIELVINDTEISLGSTVYLQAEPDHAMWVYVLEGQAIVTAESETQVVPQGSFTWVPIDEDLHATGSPSESESYDTGNLDSVPISNLETEIDIADPASDDVIETAHAQSSVAGYWTNTDTDGSSQWMIIHPTDTNSFDVTYRDEGASVCGKDASGNPIHPVDGHGTGELDGSMFTLTLNWACDGGNGSSGTVSFAYTIGDDNTMTDDSGLIWSRQ